MQNFQPIVHIGYPKTGTTWFQKQLYPKVKDIYFFSREELIEHLINIDIFSFDPPKARRELETLANGKRMVICEELLVGGLDIPFGLGEFIKVMADRLRLVFPDAEIVIFVRNQVDIIASAYFQYIRSGGTYSVRKYLNANKTFNAFFKNHLLYSLKFFQFDLTIRYYEKLFTKEQVSVFLYEDFKTNTEQFVEEFLGEFNLGFPKTVSHKTIENLRFSKPLIVSMRFFNHFYAKNTARKSHWINVPKFYALFLQTHLYLNRWAVLSRWRKSTSILGKNNIEKINNFYKASNQNLAKYVELKQLRNFNYPL